MTTMQQMMQLAHSHGYSFDTVNDVLIIKIFDSHGGLHKFSARTVSDVYRIIGY